VLAEVSFWYKDFRLTIVQNYLHSATHDLAVSGIQSIANRLTLGERMVGDFVVLLVGCVGQSNKELASRECVEVLCCISLDKLLAPDLRLFALRVNFRNELVQVA
jgi:hypothetical protein